MKRSKLVLIFAMMAIGVLTVAWVLFRNANEAQFVGQGPPGLILIPRSQFNSKPWLSIPWFGGGRFEYPPRVAMPSRWKDDPLASGIFTWPNDPRRVDLFGLHDAMALPFMQWIDPEGQKHWIPLPGSEPFPHTEYANCPYVFGTEPRHMRVRLPYEKDPFFPMVMDIDFEIRLPSTGHPAPPLPPHTAKVGPWHLTFRPTNWLGPSFGATCRVTAEGLREGETLFVHNKEFQVVGKGCLPVTFSITKDRPATISVGFNQDLTVHLVNAVNRKLRYEAKPSFWRHGPEEELTLTSPEGSIVQRGSGERGQVFFNPKFSEPRIVGIKHEEDWLGPAFEHEPESPHRFFKRLKKPIANGLIEVVAFESARSYSFSLSGLLPASR